MSACPFTLFPTPAGPVELASACQKNGNLRFVSYVQKHETPWTSPKASCENSPWLILQTPESSIEKINALRDKVRYVASLPDGVMVLVDNGCGVLQPQRAFQISHNVIFVFGETEHLGEANAVNAVLYRNPVLIFSTSSSTHEGVMFSTADVASFLFTVGENNLMQSILEADACYAVIDRYLVAMAFIYLKRAKLSSYFVCNVIFALAAMLLAHKQEEDEAPGRCLLKLIHKCFHNKVSERKKLDFVQSIVSYQTEIFKNIGYRTYVTVEECENVISVAPKHPIWNRWRLSFHGGAVRDSLHLWKLDFINRSGPATVLPLEGDRHCLVCKGNFVYCCGITERYSCHQFFASQQSHLSNILQAVSEVHNENLSTALQSRHMKALVKDMDYSTMLNIDIMPGWPIEYYHLLQIEDHIEVILANEKYLNSCVSAVKLKLSETELAPTSSVVEVQVQVDHEDFSEND